MAGNVAELRSLHSTTADSMGQDIAHMWNQYDTQRQEKIQEWEELRNYIFATDTTTTSNSTLPWKNATTLPKLCQIRDNLHANYISALFPNDNWVEWKGYSLDDDTQRKTQAAENYITNKAREGGLREVVSQLLYDYIDYGNAFARVRYVNESHTDNDTGEVIQGYVGPKVERISPMDIVFNPTASCFSKSPKITRSIITIGEMKALAMQPGGEPWRMALEKTEVIRKSAGQYTVTDYNKAVGISVDGFGNLKEYYGSQYVEVLMFEGDYYDCISDTLHEGARIIVIDRAITVSVDQIPSWLGNKGTVAQATWRKRPDNLYGMGPLDNLVGMQYRIDHLENLKADAMDLVVHPPLKIIGDVDTFTWGPGSEIPIIGEGDVQELGQSLQGLIAADNNIAMLEAKMEEFAGSPKQAMGVRTPGEKTAFEVQALENAAGRIFQEKITNFEITLLEPLLNMMLEEARRNLDGMDVIRVMDDDFGVEDFLEITKEDITARGTIRPIGARHFSQQNQLLQNLSQTFAGPMGQMIMPHTSGKQLSKLVEDALQVEGMGLFRPNVAIAEQQETASLAAEAQDQVEAETMTNPMGEEDVAEQEADFPPF